jgi:hypothetical protein
MATRIEHGTVKTMMEIYARASTSADREATTLLQQRFAEAFADDDPGSQTLSTERQMGVRSGHLR